MSTNDRPSSAELAALIGVADGDRARLPITFEVLDALSGRHVTTGDMFEVAVAAVAALEERLVRLERADRDHWIAEQERPRTDARPRPGPYRR